MVRSGKKNSVVDIMQHTQTGVDPDYNTPVYSDTAWKSGIFCNIVPRRGRENVVEGQIVAETWIKFEFEYFDVEGINQQMWILHNGVAYDISAILEDHTLKEWTAVDTVRRG